MDYYSLSIIFPLILLPNNKPPELLDNKILVKYVIKYTTFCMK